MKPTKVLVKADKRGRWSFVAKSRNGQVIAQGEVYANRWNAIRGAYRAFPYAALEVRPIIGVKRKLIW